MLDYVTAEGYGTFRDRVELRLRPLTVLFGKNNSGKTTLARLPLFIAAATQAPDLVALNYNDLRFAGDFGELASAEQPHPRIRTSVEWSGVKLMSFSLQQVSSGADLQDAVRLTELSVRDGQDRYERTIEHLSSGIPSAPGSWNELESTIPDEASRQLLSRCRTELGLMAESATIIPSHRSGIEQLYEARSPLSWHPREYPYQLLNDSELLQEVSDWLSANYAGSSLAIERATFAFRVLAGSPLGTESLTRAYTNAARLGRGLQALLPIAVAATAVSGGYYEPSLLHVEEPEVHVHPSAHGSLMDLLISASRKSQVTIETHSEHLLLRLRRRISEGVINADDVSLAYLDEFGACHAIPINRDGSTQWWPAGMFESDLAEAEAIVEERLKDLPGFTQ